MIPGLQSALLSRKKYVEEASNVTIGSGAGSGRTDLNGLIASGSSKFALLQGGLDKSETGFTGLVNQGATCYLNSLLQTLFMVPEFRAAMYDWRYDPGLHGEPERCLTLQLQRLFARLQTSARAAVTTGALTKSFGWSSSDAFVQQDVQECMSVIFNYLQTQALADHISSCHEGRWMDYLRCLNCGNPRGREEAFRDLQLDVKGMSTLEESLRAFSQGEELEGVSCDACNGRHNHTKGLALISLPHILTLQLKRFDLDYTTFQRVKLNDRIAIPPFLDMRPFVRSDENDGGQGGDPSPLEYELLAVLCHVGSAMAGHYFAYIRDLEGDRWLNFNDASVTELSSERLHGVLCTTEPQEATPEDSKEAGPASAPASSQTASSSATKPHLASSNAYMLVYRRKRPENASTVDQARIPPDIVEQIAAENAEFHALRAEWEEERKWLNITVHHDGAGRGLRVHEDRTVADLTTEALEAFQAPSKTTGPSSPPSGLEGLPLDRVRLRLFDSLKNILMAPLGDPQSRLKDLPDDALRRPLRFEVRDEDGEFEEYLKDGLPLSVLLFDAQTKEFATPLPLAVPASGTVSDLRATACKKLRLDPGDLHLVHFAGSAEPHPLTDESQPLVDLGLSAGDTVHAEVAGEASSAGDEGKPEGASWPLVRYLDSLVHMITIYFTEPEDPAAAAPPVPPPAAAGPLAELLDKMAPHEVAAPSQRARRSVQVDVRNPLARLKEAIGQDLGLGLEEFKVRRTEGGIELKDLDLPVAAYGLEEGMAVHIKLGKPMVPGEWQFNVKLVPSVDAKVVPLGPHVLQEDLTVREIKVALHQALASTGGGESPVSPMPAPDHMRLRQAAGTGLPGGIKLGAVMPDDKRLCDIFGERIMDGKFIAIQPTAGDEHFTDEHMLLRVRCWSPQAQVLGPMDEVAVRRAAPTSELREVLLSSQLLPPTERGPPASEHLSVVKPFGYLLKDLANLPLLKWKPQPREDVPISEGTLRLKDGDLVVFKDSREEEVLSEEVLDKQKQAATGGLAGLSAPVEQGFVIYTEEQQREREAKLKVEEVERKQEADQRLAQIMEGLAKQRGETGGGAPSGTGGGHGGDVAGCTPVE
mmetsp:Transcript_23792/g.69688  ORF Transcript_23792/g.69688 Transcript_23792/m.69688 type:complete len:1099 (-) Transcript_23792:114-3410(-)|eukprot:CAMPEP_0118991170 /NCGR_PEP_ID=MMETSP1173-20130426/51172_1 /TAXON_ID=1034831 /ORGANISM="Rhizochromulina marina cf, Strain CCMP1243" /LENGTH=1098 /DNA_ID=CAMNT_0006942281 /DNA_START=95 /DNA_END=3391 /DNA_ORIENTATION=+